MVDRNDVWMIFVVVVVIFRLLVSSSFSINFTSVVCYFVQGAVIAVDLAFSMSLLSPSCESVAKDHKIFFFFNFLVHLVRESGLKRLFFGDLHINCRGFVQNLRG